MCSSSVLISIVVLLMGHFSPGIKAERQFNEEIEFVDLETSYQGQYAQCCEIGKKQAINKGYCSSNNFADECKSLSELCCLEQLSLRECQAGVKFATKSRKNGHSEDIDCIRLNSFRESYEYRCCSACRMGLLAADNRLGGRRKWCSSEWIQAAVQNLSTFSSLVTSHIESSYVQCCNHGLTFQDGSLRDVNDNVASLKAVVTSNTCEDGFEFDKKSEKCVDFDECASKQNECHKTNQFCVNTVGAYTCSRCKPGFHFDDQLDVCRDVNECEQRPSPCKPGQTCMNFVGSFKCFCQVGYEMDKETGYCHDVNECQTNTHNCHSSLRCDNTIGSFHCVRVQDCGTGYTINADHDVCEDVNECILGTHNCGMGYQCRNTQGSFKCDRINCLPNQELVNGFCQELRCPVGQQYNQTAGACTEVDHCASNPCKSTENCINVASGFSCIMLCPPGYQYNQTSDRCVDLDECANGQFECGPYQECVNLPGNYDCACRKGFFMDASRTCQDVDECTQEWWLCQHPHKCTNTIGSFSCEECATGYSLSGEGQCEDVDECAYSYLSSCEHICHNTAGSFRCGCREGYKLTGDGKTCIDVDECALMAKMEHSFVSEFELDGYNVSNIKPCQGVCLNTDGGYECKCPTGFRKYSDHCVDINECLENSRLCSSNNLQSTCINTFGSHECLAISCPLGYKQTVTYKSVQCLWIENQQQTPTTHEHIHKLDYLFYSMYSNQTAQFNRSSTYTFYATRFTPEDGQQANSYSSKYGTYFDLRLISATPSISQHEYFRLTKRRLHEATISLLKPLTGPQVVNLELTIIGYKKYSYYRQKVHFTINVSKYGSM